ncbi:hypothetical protein DFR24_1031 [Panacagrimonas perspica]|uniref:Uncharacterized protein n=1 Tax=Panacagrimonas perspica TaxID=381431 RepID=A0A4S3K5X7_9GAMM|nr:hypothetical protein [Panacagrimonas perspica]TDU31655.1 hypothetical protein DFR24_1031 [Panacagrimonas perspica]THD03124.1 hypothetical protein B1810_11080 [Panacagrimonas perspica]
MYFPIFRANLAVMSFLRSAHLAAQERVELRELRAQWSRYGLRRRDLGRSLERLESMGFIEVDRVRGHQFLVLTDMGHRSAYSVIGLIESLAILPRRLGRLVGALKFWRELRGLDRRAGDGQPRGTRDRPPCRTRRLPGGATRARERRAAPARGGSQPGRDSLRQPAIKRLT